MFNLVLGRQRSVFQSVFSGSLAGAGWMLIACILYTALAVVMKYAAFYFSVAEIIFYRNLTTLMFACFSIARNRISFKTGHIYLMIILGMCAATSNFTYGYGLVHLPFSVANTLNYTHPIFLAVFGLCFFKLPVERLTLIALISAFIGVVLLLQPKSLPPECWKAGVVALISGIAAGLLNLMIYRLGSLGEPQSRVIGYFSLCSTSVMALLILLSGGFHFVYGIMWMYIVLLGLFSAGAQFMLVRSFNAGKPNVTSLFSYSTVLYSVILDLLFFQKNHFNVWSGVGIAMILGGGLLVTWLSPASQSAVKSS